MNKTPWTWTVRKETAARLIAEGDLPLMEVGRRVGVDERTLRRWKRVPEFRKFVQREVMRNRVMLEEASRVSFQERAIWRLKVLDRLTDLIDIIPDDQLAELKKTPVTAINLILRLQNTVETYDRRKHSNLEESDDTKLPHFLHLEPERVRRVLDLLERGHPQSDSGSGLPSAEIL